MRHRLLCLLLAALSFPVAALAEPADIFKYRFRGEGVSLQLGTPVDPCVQIVDRGVLNAALAGSGKDARSPAAGFYMAVDNVCTYQGFVIYGQVEAPTLFMTTSAGGKTIVLRGTLPITTENLSTGAKVSEQLIFDLVFSASAEGRRRRQGLEHVDLKDRGFRSITTFDQREYANVTASGSFTGTVAGLPVGLGNIGNFVIQMEQDRMVQVQKY